MPLPLRWSDGSELDLNRPRYVGILNVTPDSFSDGGRFLAIDHALAQAQAMLDEGADVIDVGGESTRPGSGAIDEPEQLRRVVAVIANLAKMKTPGAGGGGGGQGQPVRISIDTQLPSVARAALDAGASMINDICAGSHPGMLELAAQRQVPIILMHMQGTPATMQTSPAYNNVVFEVLNFLLDRARLAERAGIASDRIVIDPGFGFGKTVEHNLQLLAHLPRFTSGGYPVLIGTSRKGFLAKVAGGDVDGSVDLPPIERDPLTALTTAIGVTAGVRLFRVHRILANRLAGELASAVARAGAR